MPQSSDSYPLGVAAVCKDFSQEMPTFYLEGTIGWVSLSCPCLPLNQSLSVYSNVFMWQSANLGFSCWWKIHKNTLWLEVKMSGQESQKTALWGDMAPPGGFLPFPLSSPCLEFGHGSSWCGAAGQPLGWEPHVKETKRSLDSGDTVQIAICSGLPSQRFFYKNGKGNLKHLPENLYTIEKACWFSRACWLPMAWGRAPHQSSPVFEDNQTEMRSQFLHLKKNCLHLKKKSIGIHIPIFNFSGEITCCIFRHLKELPQPIKVFLQQDRRQQ